jgi:hypothetical protein
MAKVANIRSARGNIVPNQFIIETESGVYFQSYKSVIVYRDNDGKIYLDERYWDYSRTTAKYRNIFLGENKQETLKKINDGTYTFKELNK